jgi:type IV pilus assembly protein PilX
MMRSIANTLWNDRASVLVIGLLTLALLSLIGISATTTSRIEIEISGNDKAYKEAFFAAELGLTVAETTIEALPSRVALQEDTTAGHYGQGTQPPWDALKWDDTDSVKVPVADIPSGLDRIAAPPRYTIEQRTFRRDSLTVGIGVPTGVYLFNVLSRGSDSSDTGEVILQTIYAKRYD